MNFIARLKELNKSYDKGDIGDMDIKLNTVMLSSLPLWLELADAADNLFERQPDGTWVLRHVKLRNILNKLKGEI